MSDTNATSNLSSIDIDKNLEAEAKSKFKIDDDEDNEDKSTDNDENDNDNDNDNDSEKKPKKDVIKELFSFIDIDKNGVLSFDEAENVLLRINKSLGKDYNQNDIRAFFDKLDINRDGSIDFIEFSRAFNKSFQ
jgi:hypothetical protein